MTRPYVVSKGAAADLREITRYTLAQWGETQCRTYIAELERAATTVAKGDGIFKDMSFLLPGLRMEGKTRNGILRTSSRPENGGYRGKVSQLK